MHMDTCRCVPRARNTIRAYHSHESASRGSTRNYPSVFDNDCEFSVFYDEAARNLVWLFFVLKTIDNAETTNGHPRMRLAPPTLGVAVALHVS